MNRKTLLMMAALGAMLTLSFAAQAQPETRTQVDPSYDVELQLVIGSNDAAQRTDLPADLGAVSRQIKGSMPFNSYRLASTFLGRLAANGSFQYKSLSNIFGQEVDLRSQSFLEWSLVQIRSLPTQKGGEGFQAQGFIFGAKVPVVTGSMKDETGKVVSATNFESIGLNLNKVGLAANTPTLIGTLNLPGANGTIFLVMTVRSVDM